MRPERFQLPAVMGAAMMSLASGCSCTRRKHVDPLPETSMTPRPRFGTENAPSREPWLACPHALSVARQGGTDSDRYVAPNQAERSALADAIARLLSREGVDRKAASDSAASESSSNETSSSS